MSPERLRTIAECIDPDLKNVTCSDEAKRKMARELRHHALTLQMPIKDAPPSYRYLTNYVVQLENDLRDAIHVIEVHLKLRNRLSGVRVATYPEPLPENEFGGAR